jgi:hypothetical protein
MGNFRYDKLILFPNEINHKITCGFEQYGLGFYFLDMVSFFFMQEGPPIYRSGIGQDSHRFLPPDSSKPCIVGGVIFDGVPGLDADSDGDVVYHAICNAMTSLSGVPI